MSASRGIVLCSLVCWSMLAAACAAQQDRYDAATLARLKARFKDTTVVVNVFTPKEKWEGVDEHLMTSRSATVAYLQQHQLFGQVLMSMPQPPQGRVVVVNALLNDFRIVHGAARFFGGALAGSSYMNYQVSLADGANGAALASNLIESANNAYGAAWSGGSSDRSLPYDMGGIIGEYVIQTLEGLP